MRDRGCGCRWLLRGRFAVLVARRCRAYLDVMSLIVNLPGELGAALEAEAARCGQTPDRVAADLLAAGLLAPRAPQGGVRRTLAFAASGESTSGVCAADADAMLAEGFGRE
jgi:plasmid stability protein